MGWFDTFRDGSWNTYYGDKRHAVTIDLDSLILIFFTVVLCVIVLVLVIGSRGREKWLTFLRLLLGLHTGVAILGVVNNSQGQPGYVYYNEEFGFVGASDLEEAVASALRRGLPHPVIHVLEYFGVDTAGLRWSRFLREAGHFTYILLWASLATWIISNTLLCFDIIKGAFLTLLTGVIMVSSCILYGGLQPKMPLVIPVQDGHLLLRYGWCFWLCVLSGGVTLLTGGMAALVHKRYPALTSELFLTDACHEQAVDDDGMECEPSELGPLEIETPYSIRKKSRDQMLPYTFDNVVFEENPSDGSAILMQPPAYNANEQQTEPELAGEISRNDATEDIKSTGGRTDSSTMISDDKDCNIHQMASAKVPSVVLQPKRFTTVVTIETSGENDEQTQEHLSRSFMSNPF